MVKEILRNLRQKRKWSIAEAANKLFISKSTYAGYEYGRRNVPNELLPKIADLYGVSVDSLLGRDAESIKIKMSEILLEINEEELRFLEDIRAVPVEDLDYIRDLIKRFKKN